MPKPRLSRKARQRDGSGNSLPWTLALCLAVAACGGNPGAHSEPDPSPAAQMQPDEVRAIIEHASRAIDRDMAVAVSDRRGVILAVATNFDLDYATTCAARPCPASNPPPDCAVADLA
ncbi:MAG: hypothetical protein HY270_11740, partial [Deltaproteobacteria bacterium]|nr:hypothetical protein [Deltaproteobacteria bacterium]